MLFIRMMNDMKMKKKLAITFISAAVLPLLLSGLLLTGKLRETVINDAFMQVTNNVERVRKRTEELIKVPLDISYRLTVDNRMMRVATQNYESYVEVIKAYRGYTDIRDYIQWYKEAIDQKGLAGWNLIKDERDGNEYLSLIRSFSVDSLG